MPSILLRQESDGNLMKDFSNFDIEQVERISTMEQRLNEALPVVSKLMASLDEYEKIIPKLKLLEEYYVSPQWMHDFDDDRNHSLPPGLCRGVLSEDTLYDLLCDNDTLKKKMIEIVQTFGKGDVE